MAGFPAGGFVNSGRRALTLAAVNRVSFGVQSRFFEGAIQ
jgi:hypothetical protein